MVREKVRVHAGDQRIARTDLERRQPAEPVLSLVRELAQEGRSALVVSHDLGLAARECDRVALLAEGRILAAGPPAETLEPGLLRRAFGVDAEILRASDGSAVVVPRRSPGGGP